MSHNNSDGSKPTIKVASKDANQRTGPVDPGPGDIGAAPSTAPVPVDIPDPPTASQLVVKSIAAKSELGSSMTGSHAGPAASNVSGSSKKSGTAGGAAQTSTPVASDGVSAGSVSPALSESPAPSGTSEDGVVEDEIADGEVEPASPTSSAKSSSHHSNTPSPAPSPSTSPKSLGSTANARPQSSTGFKSSGSTAAMGLKSSKGQSSSSNKSSAKESAAKDKKVTRFRYHKRITVRTTGKTNPASVMNKVGQPSISPSTIDELDPKELLRRAGIKSSKHWRIRLRQTKRITKNGKTTTQTKTAYRDSSGNHTPPTCKKCGKSRDECKCADKDKDKDKQ